MGFLTPDELVDPNDDYEPLKEYKHLALKINLKLNELNLNYYFKNWNYWIVH